MSDLITLEDYKAYKGIGKNDKDDKINLIISAVSALIKTYVGHGIIDNWNEPLTEEITLPYDSQVIYLSAYPVRNITSVTEAIGGYVGGLDSTIHYPVIFNSGFSFDPGAGTIRRIGGNWARRITVSYTAGYEEAPAEIKLAAIELVSYYLNEEWKPTRTTQGTSMVGPAPDIGGMPKHIQVILDKYKVGL